MRRRSDTPAHPDRRAAKRRAILIVTLALLVPLAAACGKNDSGQPGSATNATGTPLVSPTSVLVSRSPSSSLGPNATLTPTPPPTGTSEPVVTATAQPDANPSVQIDGDVVIGEPPSVNIFVIDAGGSAPRRLTDDPDRAGSPAWSPDGRSIAFTRWGPDGAGVFVMDATGSNVRQIADVDGAGPVWSPDGLRIAVTSAHGYLGDYPQIYLIAADGSGQQRLTSYENVPTPTLSMGNDSPAWSPDGRQIAFVSEQLDGPSQVQVMQADGTQVRRLTDFPGRKLGPIWSPDGEWIAFGTDAADADIWIMRADGTALRNLTASPTIETDPAWSPDGTQLAFVRQSDADFQIVVVTPEDAAERVLYDSGDAIFTARWSPDGQRLAFVSGNPERNSDLFVINADGSGLQQLTTTPESEIDPAWSPDGAAIVYVVEFRDGAPTK
jgi:TolB protein